MKNWAQTAVNVSKPQDNLVGQPRGFRKTATRHLLRGLTLALGILVFVTPFAAKADENSSPRAIEALKIATDAYVFGYPLVTFDTVRQQNTNVAVPDDQHAPMGQMIKMRSYPAVDNHCCAAPNADTLYTMVWLDVSEEPWVFAVPDMGDRYYILPFTDGWSEVFHVSSQPLNGGKAQTYAVTGPGWSGTIPDGMVELKSPTGMVWVLGRIYSDGTDADYAAVHKLQDAFQVMPLAAWGNEYTPPKGKVDPSIDMKTGVRKQVNAMDAETYFDRLAKLMKTNPPTAADAEMVAEMAKIGIVPGQDFDLEKLRFFGRELLVAVPKMAQLEMGVHLKRQSTTNGWLYFTKGVGDWGTDYLLRGMGNMLGPGWNRPQDAIYPLSQKDAKDRKYDGGKHKYTILFEKGKLPPANAFWSVTMYDENLFFVPNAINRYELGSRSTFVTGSDGSIELYLQSESPGKDKETNWLPTPKGEFALIMRLYDPSTSDPSILDGTWKPPAIERAE